MAVRLNRLFEADGRDGIREFRRMARHYGSLGLEVTVQVRYHPAPEQNGDIAAWLDYVRRVVRAFGPNRHVTALQITNEVNLDVSPNTSNGAYPNAVDALARGVPAAKREAQRLGYDQLTTGFNYAWRFGPGDADFGRVAAAGASACAGPPTGSAWTPTPGPSSRRRSRTPAMPCSRRSHSCASAMPLAGFGPRVPIRVDELGYPTGPGRSDEAQAAALTGLMRALDRYRGTYGIEEAFWFGLRDNNSAGPNFQSYFGLLRDDYSRKPAFALYERLIRRHGA